MAIDPSLITDTLSRWQTPQFAVPDPLAQYARLQALKNGVVQQQVQQQELQSGALDLQQKQQTIGAQKALGDAIQSSIGKGPDGTPTIDHNAVVSKLSASPYAYTVPKYMEGVTAKQEADAKLKAAQLDNATKGLDLATREFSTATDQPSWDQAIAHAQGLGVDTAKMGIPPVYSDQAKTAVLNYGMSVKDRLDTQAKLTEADAKKKDADIAGDKLSDERIERALNAAAGATDQSTLNAARNQVLKLGGSASQVNAIPMRFEPDAMAAYRRSRLTPEQSTQADQRAGDAAALEANRAAELAQGRQRIGISAADLALRNQEYQKKYGDALGNLSDNDKTIAGKLAAGELNPSTLGRLPNKEQILAGAIQINPAWTQATYDTKQSFTNPEKTQAKNLGTISRIVSHIGRFETNSQQMGLAPLYAAGVNLTGNQAALNEDAHAISGELEKLVSGGVGSEGQIQAWQKALHSPSAEARQKAVDEISQLVGGQYESMNQTYKTAIGSDLPVEKYISPAGQAWMKAKGINVTNAAPGAGASGLGGGQTVSKQDVQDYATKHSLSYAAAEAHVKANGFTVK
jgi:hypothetical protein